MKYAVAALGVFVLALVWLPPLTVVAGLCLVSRFVTIIREG